MSYRGPTAFKIVCEDHMRSVHSRCSVNFDHGLDVVVSQVARCVFSGNDYESTELMTLQLDQEGLLARSIFVRAREHDGKPGRKRSILDALSHLRVEVVEDVSKDETDSR